MIWARRGREEKTNRAGIMGEAEGGEGLESRLKKCYAAKLAFTLKRTEERVETGWKQKGQRRNGKVDPTSQKMASTV